MKVLYFLESFGLGGIESFVLNVLEHADQSQNNISCCVGRMTTESFSHRIARLKVPFYDLGNDYKGFPGMRYQKGSQRLTKFLTDNRYDILHIHANHGVDYLWARVAKKTGVPKVVIHSHNTGVTKGRYKSVGHNLFRGAFSHYIDAYFACSIEAAHWLLPQDIFRDRDYRLIPNGIVLDDYRFNSLERSRLRSELGIEDKFVCGHVGRFNFQKNHEFLLRAFERIHTDNPDTVLVLVGEGELFETVRNQAYELGIINDIRFLGPRNDVNLLLSAFDVLLFPSRFEGLSVVLVEAQTAGLPIIASSSISPDTMLSSCLRTADLDEGIWRATFNNLRHRYDRSNEIDQRLLKFDILKSISEMDDGYKALGAI